MSARRCVLACGVVLVTLIASALPAVAQDALPQQVRVVDDQLAIWRPGFIVIASTVKKGDVLDVVGRQGSWFEVVIPNGTGRRETGLIAASRVEPVQPGAAAPASQAGPRGRPAPAAPRSAGSGQRRTSHPVLSRIFGEGGYAWFSANRSFDTVLGKSAGPWYGGGFQFDVWPRYRFEAVVEHFQSSGQRVFQFDGTTYPLGISDTVAVTPIMGTAAIRIPARGFDVYVGGGAGVYVLDETSDFAESTDNVSDAKGAYRALGGIQWRLGRTYAAALEVQYTTVPSAFSGGVAAALNDSNLGGLQVKAKILFGK